MVGERKERSKEREKCPLVFIITCEAEPYRPRFVLVPYYTRMRSRITGSEL